MFPHVYLNVRVITLQPLKKHIDISQNLLSSLHDARVTLKQKEGQLFTTSVDYFSQITRPGHLDDSRYTIHAIHGLQHPTTVMKIQFFRFLLHFPSIVSGFCHKAAQSKKTLRKDAGQAFGGFTKYEIPTLQKQNAEKMKQTGCALYAIKTVTCRGYDVLHMGIRCIFSNSKHPRVLTGQSTETMYSETRLQLGQLGTKGIRAKESREGRKSEYYAQQLAKFRYLLRGIHRLKKRKRWHRWHTKWRAPFHRRQRQYNATVCFLYYRMSFTQWYQSKTSWNLVLLCVADDFVELREHITENFTTYCWWQVQKKAHDHAENEV